VKSRALAVTANLKTKNPQGKAAERAVGGRGNRKTRGNPQITPISQIHAKHLESNNQLWCFLGICVIGVIRG
jgi:hypothetical protein